MDESGHSVEERGIPEAVKRHWLSESLRGPAMEVIRSLEMGKKDSVAMDYIEALNAVFRRVEETSDLLYKFNHTRQ